MSFNGSSQRNGAGAPALVFGATPVLCFLRLWFLRVPIVPLVLHFLAFVAHVFIIKLSLYRIWYEDWVIGSRIFGKFEGLEIGF